MVNFLKAFARFWLFSLLFIKKKTLRAWVIFPRRLIYNSKWVAGVHSYVIRSIWWDRGAFVYFHPSLLSTSPPAVCIFFSASPLWDHQRKKCDFIFSFLLLQYFNHFSLYHLLSFCLQLCFFLYRQISFPWLETSFFVSFFYTAVWARMQPNDCWRSAR